MLKFLNFLWMASLFILLATQGAWKKERGSFLKIRRGIAVVAAVGIILMEAIMLKWLVTSLGTGLPPILVISVVIVILGAWLPLVVTIPVLTAAARTIRVAAMPRTLFRYRIAIAGNLVVVPIPVSSILYILGYRIAAFSLLTLVGFGILLFFAFVFSEDENNNHAPTTA